MKLVLFIVFGLIFLSEITRTWSTISPDSKNKKSKKEKITSKKGTTFKTVIERGLVSQNVTAVDILREHGIYCKHTDKRQFLGDVLGYITPWNGGGYEIPKTFHGKFTMVSPIWLTINAENFLKDPATHDFKPEWVKEIRALDKSKHSIKIYPRILFEHWSVDHLDLLWPLDKYVNILIGKLVRLAQEHGFDGYVLEIWNSLAYISGTENTEIIVENLIQKLNRKGLDIVLAIPPKRGTREPIFSKKHFDNLEPLVTGFSLMTYDYSNIQHPGPNSPFDWIRECVEYLVPEEIDIRRRKILMGMNFYGNHYTPQGGGPIIGSKYLELLQEHKGKLDWDEESKEHFFEVRSTENRGYVFFPTLHSIKSRIDLAKELRIGISIWELGQGLDYFYDLL